MKFRFENLQVWQNARGFTLIELLVTISIIAILSTIGIATYQGVQAKARDGVRKNDLIKLAAALEIYNQQNKGSYITPPGNTSTQESCTRGDTEKFYGEMRPLMDNNVPKDPNGTDNYCYIAVNGGQSYRLFAKLENCSGSGGNLCSYPAYNYSIVSPDLTIAAAPGDLAFCPCDNTINFCSGQSYTKTPKEGEACTATTCTGTLAASCPDAITATCGQPIIPSNSCGVCPGTGTKCPAEKVCSNNSCVYTPGWHQVADAPWRGREQHLGLVYNNKVWILGGRYLSFSDVTYIPFNDVWYSTDGTSWNSAPNEGWSARSGHAGVVFNDKMWILGGVGTTYKNDVWYSTGEDYSLSWTKTPSDAPWATRHGHAALVFQNKMWVLGGQVSSYVHKNDVWSSADGVTWIQVQANAPWAGRSYHGAVVYKDKMWILGGVGYYAKYNDVWYSSDGATWTRATANPGWVTVADSNVTLVYTDPKDNKDKMWILRQKYPNDVWVSEDGITWTQIPVTSPWGTRLRYAALAHNMIWVLGGALSSNYTNHVWQLYSY